MRLSKGRLNKSWRRARKAILWLLAFLLIYSAVMFVLSRITVNARDTDPSQDVAIFIKTNGVHTDLLFPLHNDIYDWRPKVDASGEFSRQGYQYAAFGWGDRDFYLNTPRWSDLKISTALQAAFWMGKGVMHVTFHELPQENGRCRKIRVSKAEYARLAAFVASSFSRDGNASFINIPGAGYGDHDLFFEADGKYNLFYTCNSWANNGLKAGRQKAALWTLTDTGIFCHYK